MKYQNYNQTTYTKSSEPGLSFTLQESNRKYWHCLCDCINFTGAFPLCRGE